MHAKKTCFRISRRTFRWGSPNKEVITKGKEGVIMALLRKGKLSQGKAAELLDISRHELFDLMAQYDVPDCVVTGLIS
ncbi:MAG: UPF0175 family protein [bacterium]